jgi:hypothetical protein
LQTKISPAFVLFFDCAEEEMERRLLGRNQVSLMILHLSIFLATKSLFLIFIVLFAGKSPLREILRSGISPRI